MKLINTILIFNMFMQNGPVIWKSIQNGPMIWKCKGLIKKVLLTVRFYSASLCFQNKIDINQKCWLIFRIYLNLYDKHKLFTLYLILLKIFAITYLIVWYYVTWGQMITLQKYSIFNDIYLLNFRCIEIAMSCNDIISK